jgi:hypothetical protein
MLYQVYGHLFPNHDDDLVKGLGSRLNGDSEVSPPVSQIGSGTYVPPSRALLGFPRG